MTFYNRARMSTATTGTGTITLGTASTGYASFAEAGVSNGDRVCYTIEDGNSFEIGQGVYSTSGLTLTRAKILMSKIAGQAADTTPISLSGSASVYLTATASDLRNQGAYFSVERFGAVGDGSTNSATAFQAALDAAGASSLIKRVYVPHSASGYALGATVTIPEGVTIFGDNTRGMELSRIKPTSGFTSPLLQSADYGVTRKLRIGVIGLFLDGSSTTLTALRLNCQESIIRDCTIKNCFTYGIQIGGVGSGATQQALNNHIVENYLAGTIATTEFFDGIFIDYNSADNTVERNYIEACKDAGIRSRGYNNKITNNHIYSVAGTGGGAGVGIYTETSADHDISQNYIELCAAEAILMAGGGSDVGTLSGVVTGNVLRNIDTGNTSNGVIEISGADVSALTVSGNVVRRDAATSYATPYFVYFNGITPTLYQVYGNSWQSGLIGTSECNLALSFQPTGNYQPLDGDLTSIAALTTTSYGRALLTLADAAALTALGNAFTSSLKGLVPASGGGASNFLRADGSWSPPSGALVSGTSLATTSGSVWSFTGLPAGINRIIVSLENVSLSGTDHLLVQLSTGASFATGSYSSGSNICVSSTATQVGSSTGFIIFVGNAGRFVTGHMVLTHSSSNVWISSHSMGLSTPLTMNGGGSLSLGGALDGIRLTVSGTNTGDNGSVNIMYEL